MSELFILQNHDKLFLGRQKEWLDGSDPASLFKTPHKDEAVNQVFEISSKDYTQRIKVVSCKANDKGLPVIEHALLPNDAPTSAPLFTETVVADADADNFAADITLSNDPESVEPDASDELDIEDHQQPLL